MRLAALTSTVFFLLLAGCDDSEGPGPISGSCAIGSTGSGGDLALSVQGGPVELDQISTVARNTMDLERESPLAPHRLGGARWGSCEAGGVVYVVRSGDSPPLAYREIGAETFEVVAAGASNARPSLFFEADCEPVVITASSGVYSEHRRGGDDWTATTIFDPAVDLPGEDLGQPSHFAADLGRDGRWHLFAHVGQMRPDRLVHGSRAASGGDWTFEVLPAPEATEVADYAVDSSGVIHAVYRATEYPCDPCDVSLYYARLDPSGSWEEDVVQEGVWGPPHDEFCEDATLTIDGDDRPVVAAQFQRRVETGSLISAALRVYIRRGGEFCGEVVVTQSDGYAGSDGTDFTGSNPAVEVDGSGRIHVLFSDLSAWHDSTGSNTISGRVRYAVRSGESWQIFTVIEQPGQTESPSPLIGAGRLNLALSGSNDGAIFAASEWEWSTDSIYNNDSVPVELQGTARTLSW